MDRNQQDPGVKVFVAQVAPLPGSVDRNPPVKSLRTAMISSLPSRGVWIEMAWRALSMAMTAVAPLPGSVDRNKDDAAIEVVADRRSPPGERG